MSAASHHYQFVNYHNNQGESQYKLKWGGGGGEGSGGVRNLDLTLKGGFPFMAETTRNHIFSKEISQVIIAAMVLAPNFY